MTTGWRRAPVHNPAKAGARTKQQPRLTTVPEGRMNELFEFTAEEKLREITREIGYRLTLYPRWVANGKISREKADRQLGILKAIARDYQGQCK